LSLHERYQPAIAKPIFGAKRSCKANIENFILKRKHYHIKKIIKQDNKFRSRE